MIEVILAIDTATPAVTAGVVRRTLDIGGDRFDEIAARVTVDPRAHAECLTPNVVAALAEADMTMADLDAVVVGCGPGPFTGLRVGMATAAAYGHALGIPVYGVCSLDAIGVLTIGDTMVVTDARRRELYWARYHDGAREDGPAVDASSDVAVGPACAAAGSPEHAALLGLPAVDPEFPTAIGLVLAVADWDVSPEPLVPLYLRRPDAKSLAERAAASAKAAASPAGTS